MAFVNGYLTIMSVQKDYIKDKMAVHLQERMEDRETFGWPVVRAYHAVWLYHLEQGRAIWNDEVTRLKLQRALVWYRIALSPQHSATRTTNTPQASTRAPRHTGPFSVTAQPGYKVCATNQDLCSSNSAHPPDFHVCSYCLQSAHRLSKHTSGVSSN